MRRFRTKSESKVTSKSAKQQMPETSKFSRGILPLVIYYYRWWYTIILFTASLMILKLVFSRFVDGVRIKVFVETNETVFWGTTYSFNNNLVDAFLGLPYAQPPVGNDRFQTASPKRWMKKYYNLKYKKYPCPQNALDPSKEFTISSLNTTEDCLHMNIWIPRPWCKKNLQPECKLKPVIVFFYGWLFAFGGNSYYFYDGYIAAAIADVVVVVPNYRLNAFGFLNTGTEDVPGNAGLFDQAEALNWIRNNINLFGGDPNNIILFGYDSGSASVSYHLMAASTKGIAKRAIMIGGSPYFNIPSNPDKNLEKIATQMDCNFKSDPTGALDKEKTIECMRLRSISLILGRMDKDLEFWFYPSWNVSNTVPAPEQVKLQGVDILMGNTADEGLLYFKTFFPRHATNEGNLTDPVLIDTILNQLIKSPFGDEVLGYVMKSYGQWLRDRENCTLRSLVSKIFSDILFTCPVQYFANVHSDAGNKVYHYLFSSKTSFSPTPDATIATHHEDMFFLFGMPLVNQKATKAERDLSLQLIRIWTQFAKTGTMPNINNQPWPLYSRKSPKSLNISLRSMVPITGYHLEECSHLKTLL